MVRAAFPVLLLVVHAALYGSWIVDDAGIVFAYARSMVEGLGLVAQAGDAPVEAVTQPLWMVVLLPVFALNVFDPVIVPKLFGVGSAALAILIVRSVARRTWPDAGVFVDVGAIVTAANPAVAIWAASGLENGLTALLVAAYLSVLVRAVGRASMRDAVQAGVLGALLFLNRPDGSVYAPVFLLAMVAFGACSVRRRAALAGVAFGVAALGMVLVTLWRLWVFGEILPNTFLVKGEGTIGLAAMAAAHGVALVALAALVASATARATTRATAMPRRTLLALLVPVAIAVLLFTMGARSPLRALAGPLGWPLFAIALGMAARPGASDGRIAAFWLLTIAALVQFCAMPGDWMGEFRFATPLVLLGSPAIATTLGPAFARAVTRRGLRVAAAVGLSLFLVLHYGRRALRFAADPTVPMATVEGELREHCFAWAEVLGLPDASVATPDVGGALWARRLRVYDLAGLCDRRIARLVRRDRRAVADIVLDEWQPTFIMMHGDHAWWSGLTDDARFARDYVGVRTWSDAWLRRNMGIDAVVGQFVRADALTEAETIARLRAAGR